MDTQNEGKCGRGRWRGGRGRNHQQTSSGQESHTTSGNRKGTPTGSGYSKTGGATIVDKSQTNNKNSTKQAKTPLPQTDTCRSGELVSNIIKVIVTHGGSIQLTVLSNSYKDLCRGMLNQSSNKTLEGFLHDNGHILKVNPGTGDAKVLSFISDLEICRDHGSAVGSCHNECRSLHICKFRVMSRCSRGRNCLFGHNVRNEHNRHVLKSHYMEKLSKQEIQEFLSSLENRRGLTIPGICSYYNSVKGCGKPDKCPFLHVCEQYVLGVCTNGRRKCCYSHDLTDPQPQCILGKYGLADTSTSDLQTLLRREVNGAVCSSGDADSLSSSNVPSSYTQARIQWGRSDHWDDGKDTFTSSCDDNDLSSNEYVKESDTYSETDSHTQDWLPTEGNNPHCLPDSTSDHSDESPQNETEVPANDKQQYNEQIIPVQNSSHLDDTGLQQHKTGYLVSFDHCWRVSTATNAQSTPLTTNEHKELEFLYETYLRARQCTMLVNGQTMTINFETMTGSVKSGEEEEKFIICKDQSW